ncbi:MAG: hypothetical protein D6715_14680 [Calditrichaeota bacterium]|nr:MAG: hypothetical protein D6715_14680 [Calditrichota bacterium]
MPGTRLTLGKIFRFWIPLASTWLMMAVEGPFLSAVIARLPEPKFNLAAYGVAFAFALFIESPVIMMMSAATALVGGRQAFFKLRNFAYGLSLGLTLIMVLLAIPPVFRLVGEGWIHLTPEVARRAHLAVVVLLPWPGAIGYRRFYQGILIRANLTRRVAYGTVIRLASMGSMALLLYALKVRPGVLVGAGALSTGVVMEALSSRWMVHGPLRAILHRNSREDSPEELTLGRIVRFYYPLALTSVLSLGVHPVVTFFLGQSRMALESLAAMPVVNALVFIFRSLGLSFQEVGIALMGDRWQGYRMLKRFAALLAAAVLLALGGIAFSPLGLLWYRHVAGLSSSMAQFALLPTRIMALLPALTVILSFQRAVLVCSRHTNPISGATLLEVLAILATLWLLVGLLNWIGIVAAATAFVCGRLLANLFLIQPVRRALRANR